jgi:diguanylate cyclase (GGDEF)-like protein
MVGFMGQQVRRSCQHFDASGNPSFLKHENYHLKPLAHTDARIVRLKLIICQITWLPQGLSVRFAWLLAACRRIHLVGNRYGIEQVSSNSEQSADYAVRTEMRLTFNRKLLFTAYVQLAVTGTLVFGSLLLVLTLGLSPFGVPDFIDQAGSILTAVLLGAGLYSALKGWFALARLAGAVQVLLSCLSLAHHFQLMSGVLGTFLLYPLFALFSVSTGVCLIVGSRLRVGLRIWQATAAVWTTLAVLLIVGHWWFPISFFLGNNASATTLSAVFMLLIGPCFALLPALDKKGFHRLSRSAFFYAAATLILFCLSWYVLNFLYYQSIAVSSRNMLDNFGQRIEQTVRDHQMMLSRFGRGWVDDTTEIQPETIQRLRTEAGLFVEEMPSFDVIALVGESSVDGRVLGKRASSTIDWEQWLSNSQALTDTAATTPATLVTDTQSGVTYVVLQANLNDRSGKLVAVARFGDLLAHHMNLDTSPFSVHLWLDGSEVHYHDNQSSHLHSDLTNSDTMTLLGGSSFRLEVIHSDPKAEAFLPNFLILLVIFGMALSVIIATSIELADTNHFRASAMARNAMRQKKLRHIQAMIADHKPLKETLTAICELLDSGLNGYHSSLWRTDESSVSVHFVASSRLKGSSRKELSRQIQSVGDLDLPPVSNTGSGANVKNSPVTSEIAISATMLADGYCCCYIVPVQNTSGQLIGVVKLYRLDNLARNEDSLQNEQSFELINEIIPLIAMAIERHQDQESLMYASQHDALTGLPNRSMLESRLSDWFYSDNDTTRSVCLMFIDLDGFKPINDGLGHAIGDRVLMDVAARLVSHFRAEDLKVRFGGDEFVILISDPDDQVATNELVSRTLTALSEPYFIDDLEMSVTASIGISYCQDRSELTDPLMLVQQADIAMYDAKRKGKNNAQWYSEAFKTDVRSQVTLRNDLQRALINNEFELHYQPVISINGEISGFEALLRWNHPEHGRVPPDEFIPLAEETGQIIPLSEWVLDRACRDAWQLRFNDSVRVGVNIAPLHFHRSDFIPGLNRILERHDLKPEALVMELTERTLMDEHATMVNALTTLRKAGFRLSIDDFGTGYSSLSFIKHLPVNSVKIDKSFVANIGHSDVDAGMARAIIDMAHHLGLSVVAEGVETEEQLEKLRSWGCDSLQGYHLCRPANLESTLAFVASWKGFGDNALEVSKSIEMVSQNTSD